MAPRSTRCGPPPPRGQPLAPAETRLGCFAAPTIPPPVGREFSPGCWVLSKVVFPGVDRDGGPARSLVAHSSQPPNLPPPRAPQQFFTPQKCLFFTTPPCLRKAGQTRSPRSGNRATWTPPKPPWAVPGPGGRWLPSPSPFMQIPCPEFDRKIQTRREAGWSPDPPSPPLIRKGVARPPNSPTPLLFLPINTL